MSDLGALVDHWGYLAIALVVVLGNVGLPVPEETILALAGYLVWRGQLQLPLVLAVGVVSAVAGDNLGYWLGRRYGQAALARYIAAGELPAPPPQLHVDGLGLTFNPVALDKIGDVGAEPARALRRFLQLVQPGDYIGLLAYLPLEANGEDRLASLRLALRNRLRAATTLGFGPRYLHSTGQLHKGGPNSGLFLLLTADPARDVAIPGEQYSFGILELAQALGDFASLQVTGRRALRIHLPRPDAAAVDRAARLLEEALPA